MYANLALDHNETTIIIFSSKYPLYFIVLAQDAFVQGVLLFFWQKNPCVFFTNHRENHFFYFGKCWYFIFSTIEIFLWKPKLPHVLYRLGPRRFCARGTFSECAWRIDNSVCIIYINRLSRLPSPRDLRAVFIWHNTGPPHALHRWYLIYQRSSTTRHRDTTPQDAAFKDEYNAWREKAEAYELARNKRRDEKKDSKKRHKDRLTKAGQMPRHPQRVNCVSN